MRLLAHFHHQIGNFFEFIGIISVTQYFFNLELFRILYQNEIFDIDNTDDIIRITIEYRDTRKHRCAERRQHFLVSGSKRKACHMYPRHHNIFGDRITEIKHVIYQFPLFRFDRAAFVADIDVGL